MKPRRGSGFQHRCRIAKGPPDTLRLFMAHLLLDTFVFPVSVIVKGCVLPEWGTRDALQNIAFILSTK